MLSRLLLNVEDLDNANVMSSTGMMSHVCESRCTLTGCSYRFDSHVDKIQIDNWHEENNAFKTFAVSLALKAPSGKLS